MKTVAIPIENKVREVDGKMWLGLNLVGRGYTVALGPSWEIKSSLDKIQPAVYFAKDTGDGNVDFFENLRDSGIIVCGIPPESGVAGSVEDYAQHRTEVIETVDAYFSWGDEPAEAVRSRYDDSISDRHKVTGNPRFDLLAPELRSIYESMGGQLIDTYGEYVLINTNFSMGNPIRREKQFSKISEIHPDRNLDSEERHYSRVLHLFVEFAIHVSNEVSGTNVIVRPHPGEDHSTYEKAFQHFDDIRVEHEGSARPWISGARCVVHHDCTTGIEAALMGTPVLSYQPVDPSDPKTLPLMVSDERTSRDGAVSWAKEAATRPEHSLSEDQESELEKYFSNINEPAAPRICDIVDGLVSESTGKIDYETNIETKLKRKIKSSRTGAHVEDTYDAVRELVSGEKYRQQRRKERQKFPGLDEKELLEWIDRFDSHVNISGIRIERVPETRHSYTLHQPESA